MLHRAGYRFRLNGATHHGRPDIVLPCHNSGTSAPRLGGLAGTGGRPREGGKIMGFYFCNRLAYSGS